jgi:sigma-B regulation protein RsbU (phosphoserine phosphatase)
MAVIIFSPSATGCISSKLVRRLFYADSTLALAPGDRLLFFTDGVTEAENTKEEEFGYRGIANAAGTGPSSSAELKRKIMKAVEEFCHGEFRDDVTPVVACIR